MNVTGIKHGSPNSEDHVTIKYESSGVQQWVARYNGHENSTDLADAIEVDALGSVYVTGRIGE